MSETTETTWADLDLSAVVEQVAATVWDQQKPPEIAWDRVNEITRHNAREAVLPFVVAARDALAPHVEAMLDRARAEALREAAEAWQTGGWASVLPPRGADRTQVILRMAQRGTQWLRERADRVGGAS